MHVPETQESIRVLKLLLAALALVLIGTNVAWYIAYTTSNTLGPTPLNTATATATPSASSVPSATVTVSPTATATVPSATPTP